MHNERSGARRHHQKDEEVLSLADAAALVRGQDLKRCVRAAGALRDLYDDTAIGEATGVGRGAVAAWWDGAQMKPDTLRRIAEATGLAFDELTRYVYLEGPLPHLPELVPPSPAALAAIAEQAERSGYPHPGADLADRGEPPPSPRHPQRQSSAEDRQRIRRP